MELQKDRNNQVARNQISELKAQIKAGNAGTGAPAQLDAESAKSIEESKARLAKTEQKLVEANKELQNAGKGGVQAK